MYETIARYYDQLHRSLTADLGFIRALAGERGDPVLELGCGSGRILVPMAQDGRQITGIDNSPAMLALARRNLDALPEEVGRRVTLLEEDVRYLSDLVAPHSFALALIPYNTLMHFQEVDAARVLHGVARVLRPGGRLFIDLANPILLESISFPRRAVFETRISDPESGEPVEQWSQSRLDAQNQVLRVTWSFRPQNTDLAEQTADFIYHYWYPHQIELLLQRAGLRLQATLGDYAGKPYTEDSERLIVLADLLKS